MWNTINEFDRMFRSMDQLHAKMNRIFGNYDTPRPLATMWGVSDQGPRTNLCDAGEALELTMELPGIAKDAINIKLQGNYLEISGTRKSDVPNGYEAHRLERGETSFTRSFTLPTEIDTARVEAQLTNGILTLKMPKQEAAKPRQISIS